VLKKKRLLHIGYVQGMSDLLAPVFVVMRDEVTAFWAFVGFMKRMVYFRLGEYFLLFCD
jgi:hypothetical protein